MQSNLSLPGLNVGDVSILFVLIAVLILLALVAAIGAWARGGGIKKEDAQSFFSEASERHREEIARLEELLRETRKANEEAHRATVQAHDRSHEAVTARLQEVDQQVQRSRSSVEAAVSQATADYTEALSDELEMVARKLGETDRRVTTGMSELQDALGRMQLQVSQAGEQIRHALMEISKQQQDQKAQSTIQMCEALISSLSTLKSSIANQLEHQHDERTVEAEPAVADLGYDSGDAVEQTAGGELRFASDNAGEAAIDDEADSSDATAPDYNDRGIPGFSEGAESTAGLPPETENETANGSEFSTSDESDNSADEKRDWEN
jgi:hypothetical protein